MSKKVKGLFKFRKSTQDLSDWGKHDEKLVAAIEHGDLEKVDSILTKKGVLPTKLGPQGITAFHVAASVGNIQMVNLLLTHKADIQARDSQGRVALHCAARTGSEDVCEKLISINNDCGTIDISTMIPLHHACLGGHLECCKLLLQNMSPPNATDKDGLTPLFYAAQMGHPAICRELIENGAIIDARNGNKCTPLMMAAQYGKRGVCEYLVRKGANVSLRDEQGHDVTWYAQESGHHELMSIFENAPTRASWNLDTEKEEDSISSGKDKSHRSEDLESSDLGGDPPDRRSHYPPPDIASLDQVEVGIVPFHDDKGDSSFEEGHTSFESEQPEPLPREIVRQVMTPTSLASVSEEDEHREERKNAHPQTHVDIEEFRELEEEHEGLVVELQHVNQEKRRLEEQVERLHKRIDRDTEKNKQNVASVDAETILEIEQEMEGMKTDLESERKRNAQLEEQVRHFRKTFDVDSKPEAERVVDKDTWSDSDGELFDSPKTDQNETKTVILLRSQILTLGGENEKLKEMLQMCGGDGTGDTEINLRRRLTDLEEENARISELLASYEGLENEFHSMRKERSSTNDELESVEEAKALLQDKVTQLQQENDEIKEVLDNSLDKAGVTKEMRALSAKIDELQEENEKLRSKNVSFGSMDDLTKEVQVLNTKNMELQAKYDLANGNDWEREMGDMKRQIDELNKHVSNLELENKELHDTISNNKSNLFVGVEDTDREEFYTFLQQNIADLQHENAQLKQGQFPGELKAQEELRRVQGSMARLKEENESLNSRLTLTLDKLQQVQVDLDKSQQLATSNAAELQQTHTNLQDSQERLGTLVVKLQAAEEKLEQERSEFQKECHLLTEERNQLKEELRRPKVVETHALGSSNNHDDTPQDNPIVHIMQLERDMYGSDANKKEAVKRMGRHLTELYSQNEALKHQLAASEEVAQKDAETLYQLQMQNISLNEKLADEQQREWKDQKRIHDLERQMETQSVSSGHSNQGKHDQDVKKLEVRVQQLQDENASMSHKLNGMSSNVEHLQSERERLQADLSSISDQKKHMSAHLQRVLSSLQSMQSTSRSLVGAERERYEADLKSAHSSIKSLVDGSPVAPVTDSQWSEEREEMWRHMRDEVIKMRQEHQATVDENEALQRNMDRLQSELKAAQEKRQNEERDLYRLHQDRIRMEEQVVLIKELRQEISTLKEEGGRPSSQYDSLHQQIRRLQEENSELSLQIQNQDTQHHHSMEKSRQEILVMKEENTQLRRHSGSRDAQEQLSRLRQELDSVQEENMQLSRQLDQRDAQQHSQVLNLQQEVSLLKKQARHQEQQMTDMTKHDRQLIDGMQQEIVELKQANEDLQQECDSRQQEVRSSHDSLQHELSRLRQHNEGLRLELNSRHGTVEGLQQELRATKDQNQSLSAQLDNSSQDKTLLIKLQEENKSLQSELQHLSQHNSQLGLQLERRSSQDRSHLQQLQTELQNTHAENKALQTDILKQDKLIRDLRQQLNKIPAGLDIDEVMKESAALKHEIAELKRRDMMFVVTGQKGESTLVENYDILAKQSDAMRREMENLRTSLEQERQRSLKKLQVENERLNHRLAELDRENKQLRTSLLKFQNSDDGGPSRNEVLQLRQELEQMQRMMKGAERQLSHELGILHPAFHHCNSLQDILNTLEKTDLQPRGDAQEDPRNPTTQRLQDDIRKLIRENDDLRGEVAAQRSKLARTGVDTAGDRQQVPHQRQVARLQRQLEEAEQRHREVVATYRTHLLSAMQGHMDGEVSQALQHIVKLRSTDQFC